jgi:peptidyl-prolyl cis-trans isomerase D
MLQAIRDRVTGIVAIFILGLLAVPFVFFGLDSYIQAVPENAIAQVGDSEITVSEFETEFARERQQRREQLGEGYDELAFNSPQSRREFLEGMIDRELLLQHARDMGMSISPSTKARIIRDVPAFQVNGEFDPQIYATQLAASGRTPAAFERDLAADLLVQEVPAGVSGSVVVTDRDIDRWLQVQLETRRISYGTIDSQPFREQIEVSEAEIESFYADNTGQFMRPEQISVEYLVLDTNEMVELAELDEEEIRQRYEATQARFMTAERRRASHILITSGPERSEDEARELAESLRARIDAGEDFASLAEEFSDDPGSAGQGGDLGWIEPDVMMPEFEDALYELAIGEVAGPVETDFGWHIIELRDIEAPRGQRFEEARAEIAEEIRAERADDLYIELRERLIDLVYADPTGLPAIAEDLALPLETAGPFSRFNAEGVLAQPQVLEAAFSDMVLMDREASEPIEVGRNRAVVVRVTDHQPSEPRPLEAVSDEIRNRLVREAAREAAREYAGELIARIESDDRTLEQVLEAEGVSVESSAATRRSFELGGAVLEELFRLPRPAPDRDLLQVIPDGQNWMVVRLEAVEPGNADAADDAQRESARQQITIARASREFDGLLQWLRANAEINVVADRL